VELLKFNLIQIIFDVVVVLHGCRLSSSAMRVSMVASTAASVRMSLLLLTASLVRPAQYVTCRVPQKSDVMFFLPPMQPQLPNFIDKQYLRYEWDETIDSLWEAWEGTSVARP